MQKYNESHDLLAKMISALKTDQFQSLSEPTDAIIRMEKPFVALTWVFGKVKTQKLKKLRVKKRANGRVVS